jgi:hypothetical protein
MFDNIIGYFSNLWQGRNNGQPRMYGKDIFIPLTAGDIWKERNHIKMFQSIPELNAAINLKGRAFSNMKIQPVNTKGKPVEHRVTKIFANPNFFQGEKEFLRQTKIWHEIFGNEYIYLFYGVGASPEDAKRMFSLPPNLVTPEFKSNDPFFQIDDIEDKIKYLFKFQNKELSLDVRTIIHLNDNKIVVSEGNDKNILKGDSKMKSLTPALNNIRLAYESRGVILKYRGAIGILSSDAKDSAGFVPIEKNQIEQIQQDYQRYGTNEGQAQLLITSAAVKWQSMMVNNPKNLGLFEEVEEDFNKILDAYGVPSELMVRQKGATFENQRQAQKSFYENTIIPECAEWCFAFNQKMFQESNVKLIPSFAHMQIFQEDIKAKSETLNTMVNALSKLLMDSQISKQEYREELSKIGIGDGAAVPDLETEDTSLLKTQEAQAQLRGSVGGVQGILGIQASVSAGTTSPEAATAMLELVYGFTTSEANRLISNPKQNEQE